MYLDDSSNQVVGQHAQYCCVCVTLLHVCLGSPAASSRAAGQQAAVDSDPPTDA